MSVFFSTNRFCQLSATCTEKCKLKTEKEWGTEKQKEKNVATNECEDLQKSLFSCLDTLLLSLKPLRRLFASSLRCLVVQSSPRSISRSVAPLLLHIFVTSFFCFFFFARPLVSSFLYSFVSSLLRYFVPSLLCPLLLRCFVASLLRANTAKQTIF